MKKDLQHDRLIDNLFNTSALKICNENKPFWYTSGKIGPYYINTHYLYGNETLANQLLSLIDKEKIDPIKLHDELSKAVLDNYNSNSTYKSVIDDMISFIKDNIDIDSIEYISGGERRDWFFSFIVAHFMKKPHITIFKDLTMKLYDKGVTSSVPELNGASVLHIADLITEASSYVRAWIPAIKANNGVITDSVVVVDRKQGGSDLLLSNGIKSYSMIGIDVQLFNKALELGYINKAQYSMVNEYLDDADKAMKKFLMNNPEFITDALNSDEKTRQRAELCIKQNHYNL